MIPKLATLLFLGIFLLLPDTAFAQDKLYLEHPGKFKRVELQPGEVLRFKLNGDKFKYSGRYTHAHDDWIHFGQDSMLIKEIDFLYRSGGVNGRYWLGMTKAALALIAIAYPVMILLNRTAVTGYDPNDFIEMGIVSGSAVGMAFFLNIFQWKKFPLKKDNWRLLTRTPVEDL